MVGPDGATLRFALGSRLARHPRLAGRARPPTPSMLELHNLVKAFGGFHAVDGCSFKVEQGQILGLIGPNGAGKTTLFNLVAGAFPATRGAIRFRGEDITRLRTDQRFHRGLVRTFQIPHEFGRLRVLENLMMVPPAQHGERLLANWTR